MSIIKPMKRSKLAVILYSAIALLIGGSFAAWWYFDAPPLGRYAPVIAMLASHQIAPDSQGILDISKQFPGITPRNIVYVARHDDGSFVAVFPTYYGEGSELAGLLYTSRPLQDQDLHYRPSGIHFNQQVIEVGTYANLLLDKRINPNWYHVSFRLQ